MLTLKRLWIILTFELFVVGPELSPQSFKESVRG